MPINDFLIEGADPNEPDNFRIQDAHVMELLGIIDGLDFDKAEERQAINQLKEMYPKITNVAGEVFSLADPTGNSEAGRLMEEAEKLYYFLEGFMSVDSDDEPGAGFKACIVYDSNKQWKMGIEFGMTDSDVYKERKGMAFIRYRW